MAPIPGTSRLMDRAKTAIFLAVREHDPRLTTVARKLGLGSRTLQRRLREDGSTYRSLLGQVREQLAKKYLCEGDKPLSEIAYRLGFGYATEFHRAFRNTTGTTPRRFRRERPVASV
jgi:AraC-like DNA-binding protein